MPMTSAVTAFNATVGDFFADIKLVLPNDGDILAAEAAVGASKKVNVTLFLKAWRKYAEPYHSQIKSKDTSFFLAKDYSADVAKVGASSLITAIERVRKRLATLEPAEKVTIMEYVFNLTMLASLA
jgi:hypothetical protein